MSSLVPEEAPVPVKTTIRSEAVVVLWKAVPVAWEAAVSGEALGGGCVGASPAADSR